MWSGPAPPAHQHHITVWTDELRQQGGGRKQEEDAMSQKKEANQQTSNASEAMFSHQVGHDVMVAFDMFPHADNLQGGGAELSVNPTGLQHSIR